MLCFAEFLLGTQFERQFPESITGIKDGTFLNSFLVDIAGIIHRDFPWKYLWNSLRLYK